MDITEDMVRKVTKPRDKAAAMNTKELMEKIAKKEGLQMKLESSLSNQMADKAALIKLTNENAMWKRRHTDMKMKYDRMYDDYTDLLDDLERLRNAEQTQKHEILVLRREIEELRESQGGDQRMRDMQQRLVRLTEDQQKKDAKMYKLEMILRQDNSVKPQQSAVCVVL